MPATSGPARPKAEKQFQIRGCRISGAKTGIEIVGGDCRPSPSRISMVAAWNDQLSQMERPLLHQAGTALADAGIVGDRSQDSSQARDRTAASFWISCLGRVLALSAPISLRLWVSGRRSETNSQKTRTKQIILEATTGRSKLTSG